MGDEHDNKGKEYVERWKPNNSNDTSGGRTSLHHPTCHSVSNPVKRHVRFLGARHCGTLPIHKFSRVSNIFCNMRPATRRNSSRNQVWTIAIEALGFVRGIRVPGMYRLLKPTRSCCSKTASPHELLWCKLPRNRLIRFPWLSSLVGLGRVDVRS